MALKTFTPDSVRTDKNFSTAVLDVFSGVSARNQQIQQLIVIALNKAQTPAADDPTRTVDDFRWLSLLADKFESTRGLNLQQFVDYLKAHVKCEIVQPDKTVVTKSLLWDVKTKQFKKPVKGAAVQYMQITGTWFEFGKKPTLAAAFNLTGSFSSLINKAAKQAKDGALSPEDQHLFNKLKALLMEHATESKPAVQAASMEAMDEIDAALDERA